LLITHIAQSTLSCHIVKIEREGKMVTALNAPVGPWNIDESFSTGKVTVYRLLGFGMNAVRFTAEMTVKDCDYRGHGWPATMSEGLVIPTFDRLLAEGQRGEDDPAHKRVAFVTEEDDVKRHATALRDWLRKQNWEPAIVIQSLFFLLASMVKDKNYIMRAFRHYWVRTRSWRDPMLFVDGLEGVPASDGLKGVPASELYAARTAQLKREAERRTGARRRNT
jgi:hypothetical protein